MRNASVVPLLLLGTLAAPLPATLVERLTLEQLTDRSERIVHGRCGRAWSAWDAERRAIWTHCEIEVLDPLKGGSARVVVSEPGGAADGLEMHIDGVPLPRSGEEVVVFLFRVPNGYWRARGLGQGKFRVLRAAGVTVEAAVEGAALIEPLRPPVAGSTALSPLNGLALDQFKARIRAAMTRPGREREAAR